LPGVEREFGAVTEVLTALTQNW